MNLLKKTYLREILSKEIELLILFSVLLFFPQKNSLIYFLFISILILIFSLRAVFTERNLSLSIFSHILIMINIFFIITSFLSNNAFDSLILISDVLMVSIFVFILFTDSLNLNKLFFYFMLIITVFSFMKIINDLLFKNSLQILLYDNLIRIGIISGLGFIISLFFLIKKPKWIYTLFIVINLTGVYLSESKGVFLGIVFFSIIMLLKKYKKMISIVILLVIITFLISNPIKNMFEFSIFKDKYSTGRIDIWKMSIEVFKDNVFFGIGPNNFKNVAKKYNFKQLKGPANYSKVPTQTHNDYLKLMAENGLFGLLIIGLLLYAFIRKIKKNKILDLPDLLLLFLFLQAFFFNILFKPFFLFTFILLLKIVFEKKIKFVNITKNFKLVISFIVLFVFLIGHLLPYLSNNNLKKSLEKDLSFGEKDNYLKKAMFFMPISPMPLINRALLNFNVFTKTFNFDFLFSAIDLINKAKRLSSDNTEIYNIEIQFYQYYYKPIINMRKNMKREIISMIIFKNNYFFDAQEHKKAEKLLKNIKIIDPIFDEILDLMDKMGNKDPKNPFLRFNKAKLLLDFDKRESALNELKKAIEIEPDYLDALLLLRDEFNFFEKKNNDLKRIILIEKKGKRSNLNEGSYLYKLYNRSI